MDIFTLKQDILQMAELGAMAVMKIQQPLLDELTTQQAYRYAGRRWLDEQIRRRNIVGVRKGQAPNSPIIYSRLEIAALKKAEKAAAQVIGKY